MNSSELNENMKEHVERDIFSGVVLIARQGIPIFKEAYGYANREKRIENNVDTKLNIGSLNKLFTEYAIYHLYEQRTIDLNEPIITYLPELPNRLTKKITVQHLLDHKSGLGHYWGEKFIASMWDLRTVEDFVKLFIEDKLSFEPGERYQYSNSGYVLLGKIIENVTGVDYYSYIRDLIYDPMGMSNSDHYELDSNVANRAIGCTKMGLDGIKLDSWTSNENLIGVKGSPAGGGYSTVDDLLRFRNTVYESREMCSSFFKRFTTRRDGHETGFVERAGGASGVAALFSNSVDELFTVIILSNFDPVSIRDRILVSVQKLCYEYTIEKQL